MRALLPLLFALAPVALADGPEFEVASIKPFSFPTGGAVRINLSAASGGPGTNDPTHINKPASGLRNILMTAFDVKTYQIVGPDTLNSAMFDFQVVVPEGATKEQVNIMWRNLLETRFGMKYHIEQREFNVDDLVVAPRGHKLTENKDPEPAPADPNAPPAAPGPPQFDKDGKPVLNRPALMMMMTMGPNGITAKATAKAQTMAQLATMLSNQVGHPVVDKTGLTGKYDFFVEFAPTTLPGLPPGIDAPRPQQNGATPDLGLDLSTAVQQQLGLRLVGSKGKLDVIVVDKINATPTDN